MEIAKLVLLCIASLCGYGAVVGSISAALCPEAFTLGRPPSFEHWPALALGAIWGTLDLLIPSTIAGVALGFAANVGPRPALKTSFFHRVIPGLIGLMALVSIVAGIAGFIATRHTHDHRPAEGDARARKTPDARSRVVVVARRTAHAIRLGDDPRGMDMAEARADRGHAAEALRRGCFAEGRWEASAQCSVLSAQRSVFAHRF